MVMPPSTPGIGIVCTSRPTRLARRFLQARDFFLPRLVVLLGQLIAGATSTIRMSLRPRPADSVQRKRPLRVKAPPPGWLPSVVSLPGGVSSRPLGWSRVAGPTSLVER